MGGVQDDAGDVDEVGVAEPVHHGFVQQPVTVDRILCRITKPQALGRSQRQPIRELVRIADNHSPHPPLPTIVEIPPGDAPSQKDPARE
ncbi:hypothetical protein ABZY36_32765 [Streptomyces sp. NPDC006627]|uniref:hypothetical protein n=1 Tax=Streptomyces sp. NPDC006627 TaxID=3154679 RepID=UPI0033A39098